MHRSSLGVFTVLLGVALLASLGARPALADPGKCQREIMRRTAKLAELEGRLRQRCEDTVLKGKAGGPCPDAKTALKLARAESKLDQNVAKRCGGGDRTCGTGDDEDLGAIGWDGGACPGLEGACRGPIADCGDVAACLACAAERAVRQTVDLVYDDLNPTPSSTLLRCQRALGKETLKYLDKRSKALRKCHDRVFKAGGGGCPDAAAVTRIAKARAKLEEKICKRCGGADRTCDGNGDFAPDTIGVPPTCPAVTAPGGAGCGGPIASLADAVACAACVVEFETTCLAALSTPTLGAYPAACAGPVGQLIDGPVDGVAYSTDGGGTFSLTTNDGRFRYADGETVSFHLGGIDLGSAPGAPFLLPDDVLPSEQAAVNLARFLLTLDADRDPRTNVTIAQVVRDAAAGVSAPASAFDVSDAAFESSALADFARTANGDGTRTLASRAAAELELACSRTDIADGVYDGNTCAPGPGGVTWFIEDGPDEQSDALAAFFAANAGDTIEFGPGVFELSTTLVLSHKEGITIRGQGTAETILDFLGSLSPEGISASHMVGITIEDMTVLDTPGFSIKLSDSRHVVLRNVRAMWSSADSTPGDGDDDRGGMDPLIPATLDVTCERALSFPESVGSYVDALGASRTYVPDSSNGGYAIYPVLSHDVLLDNVVALGASDAGIYVGQSNDVIVKNSEALFNVAGYEIENTDDADMFDNVAHCNTGGFLIFDLPGLNQYGDETRAFDNYSGYNNTPNFAPGGIVSAVPQGVGFLQLGYDEVEVFGNTIEFNRTLGLVFVSHELVDGNANNPDKRMDLYPEGIHVHDNVFTTNGTLPQPPEEGAIICAPGTGGDTGVPCVPTGVDDSHDSLLPALVQLKGTLAADGFGPTGAHVIWDGLYDADPLPCDLTPELAAIADENGKPQYTGQHTPICRYNKYKFTDSTDPATRRHPAYWACITDSNDPNGNVFSADSRRYMNFENTDPTDPPATDIDAHDCPGRFGAQLAPLDSAVVDPYVPGAGGDPPPSPSEIAAICNDFSGTTINREAFPYNCELLSHYNLFAAPTDPRSGPNENGIPFDLTTPLFSDYARKYRFVFLPPGEPATWQEGSRSAPNATLDFPVGTVIAKTFAFRDGADEDVVETRLLFHRASATGSSFWEGMAFIWDTDASGQRTDARLAVAGGTASVTWSYSDPDPDVSATYVGSTDSYAIPHANQCGSCHINEDRQPGDAPIGLKTRLLNRPLDYGSGPENQLQHWIDLGLLAGAPALTIDGSHVATNVQRLPRFNVPGDAFNIPASEQSRLDLMTAGEIEQEMRARAWLESNCAHCHNRDGLAQSTGVFLDVFRRVDLSYGICKSPTTAGSSSGGRNFDIVPGSADDSIVSFRIHSETPGAQMPPIARSVAHDEGAALIDAWIDLVVDGRYQGSGCEQ